MKANQNSVESEHSAQKKLLGAALMKAPPLVTMTTSAPVILAAAGVSNAEPHKWPSTLAVKPRLSATVAAKARNLLNFKSIKVRSFVHSTCHPTILNTPPRCHLGPCYRCKHLKAQTTVACTSHPHLPHNTPIVTGNCASRRRLANEGRQGCHSCGLRERVRL